MEELLRFEHVSFAYEDGAEQRLALKDCSVSIGAGERVAVLGSNGAGVSGWCFRTRTSRYWAAPWRRRSASAP